MQDQAGRNADDLNYGEANIEDIRRAWDNDLTSGSRFREVYTMVQANNPCEVEITEESMATCAKVLLR
jgi:hypothetical protein